MTKQNTGQKEEPRAATATGIIERKGAEEALRLQSAALESAANAIVITDREGRITWVNPAFTGLTGLTGYAFEEAVGQNLRLLKSGKQDQPSYQNLWETILSGQVWHGEIINRRKDGSLYTEEQTITPVRDERGELCHFIAIKQDISERKQAEEELRSSEERLRILFESAPDAYYLSDLEGTLVDGNRAAEELSGYKRDELIGQNFLSLNLLRSEQTLKAAALLAKNALGQPTGPDEFTLNRKDGSLVVVEIRTFPVKITDQALVLGIARDISERKRAAEALRKANEGLETRVAQRTAELKDANIGLRGEISARNEAEAQSVHSAKLAAIGQLAAGVAHEINNPLGAIVGYAQLISGDGALSPASKAQLQRIIERAQGAANVVRELKDFAAPTKMERVSTDIHDVIERTFGLVEGQIRLHDIAVVRNYGSGLPAIECDSDRIEQVLVNLVLNARDAMADGGTLTISTEVAGDGQGIALSVSDTGKGISKDDQARIFEPFFTAGKEGGTGLGLSISQRIVEDHGGRIEVESDEGRGSRFTVWLPASAPESVSERAAA